MAGVHAITVDADDEQRARDAIDAAIADVLRIEAKYSRYRDDSRDHGDQPRRGPSRRRDRRRRRARCCATPTSATRCPQGGSTSRPACCAARGISGASRRAFRTPREIDALRALDRLAARRSGASTPCASRKPGMELDFGGIGKEYAADRAATILQERGIAHCARQPRRRRACDRRSGRRHALAHRHPPSARAGARGHRVGRRRPKARSQPRATTSATSSTRGGATATCSMRAPACRSRAWQSMSVAAPLAVVAGSCSTIAMLLEDGAVPFLEAQGVAWLGVDARGAAARHARRDKKRPLRRRPKRAQALVRGKGCSASRARRK